MAPSGLARRTRLAWLLPVAGVIALLAGLLPGALPYDRVDPRDWLLPCFLAFALLLLACGRGIGWRMLALAGLAIGLPPLILVAIVAAAFPWPGALLFAAGMAGAVWLGICLQRRWAGLLGGLLLVGGLLVAASLADGSATVRDGPAVGVSSALPLFAAGQSGDLLEGVGRRAPVIEALGTYLRPEPLDRLDAESLSRYDRLLLIQPRLLAPAELVALDGWVREGGHVTILADPWLAWPEAGALTRPGRAPLTSLLDPLMSHWGLTLEPARLDGDARARRVLTDGALIRPEAASRFSVRQGAACALAEDGLIARCRVGQGQAALVADADWADARLWTRDAEKPRDRRRWNADAVPVLAQLVLGDSSLPTTRGWIASAKRFILGLCGAIAVLVLACLLAWRTARRTGLSQLLPSAEGGRPRLGEPPGPDSG